MAAHHVIRIARRGCYRKGNRPHDGRSAARRCAAKPLRVILANRTMLVSAVRFIRPRSRRSASAGIVAIAGEADLSGTWPVRSE